VGLLRPDINDSRRQDTGRSITLRMVDVATFDPFLYSVETRIRDRVFRDLVAMPFKDRDWTLLIFSK
jgi:hypothetical protein